MKKTLMLACVAMSLTGAAQEKPVITSRAGFTLPPPPVVEKKPVTDTYKVTGSADVSYTDNYRYLEDAKAPATRAFIDAQNVYTQQYLDKLTMLPRVRESMAALLKVDQMNMPTERNGVYFFSRRKADENQGSIYMRKGLHGADVKLIDGPSRSADGNTSVNFMGVTEDGSLLTYGVRVGGADESEVHFFDLATRKDVGEVLSSARYYGVSIAKDKKGVYYSRFTPHVGCKVYFHAFGTPMTADKLLLGGEYKGEKLGEIDGIGVRVTENGHWLVFNINRGVPAKREDILLKDLTKPDAPIVPLVYGIDARFGLDVVGDEFFIDTDWKAPNHRVLKAEVGVAPDAWKTILPEGKDVIESVSFVGGRMFVLRLKDVMGDLRVYTLDGKETGHIAFPGVGSGSGMAGRFKSDDGFYAFQSLITPPTYFHYDVKSGKSEVFYTQPSPFQSGQYELKEVFFTSKDGTRVPMFIAGKKGLKRDGTERLLMTGYGGFALAMRPDWNPEYAWWMEQGGWFALPDLRGGNEYGEVWHKAAMFEHKQNVFDDWFAAAEYLIANKYTSAEHFAIRGRSNGGLLMGAAMTQRPDLFAAIWCGYPLLDMLRYQYFLLGRTWTTEYGSSENPDQFAYIAKYSPYQNIKQGAKYPAIMFFTGDGDTRVDPMNARKMTPAMQEASRGGRPILLHYSIKGGHSAGVSMSQLVEDYADEMAFLWTETK
ncbi:prolyl oligopeptidase family protein [Granulicella cerasi]|uniref:Prolyl oligopeptidase family protein n=1 Tax=Granulicella cerasi TaxID=741063 RepID=A0ABW1Z9U0_9BACT|nr:prolyl oligopeptidase family serine peptidase [Granulicella cerasi]